MGAVGRHADVVSVSARGTEAGSAAGCRPPGSATVGTARRTARCQAGAHGEGARRSATPVTSGAHAQSSSVRPTEEGSAATRGSAPVATPSVAPSTALSVAGEAGAGATALATVARGTALASSHAATRMADVAARPFVRPDAATPGGARSAALSPDGEAGPAATVPAA